NLVAHAHRPSGFGTRMDMSADSAASDLRTLVGITLTDTTDSTNLAANSGRNLSPNLWGVTSNELGRFFSINTAGTFEADVENLYNATFAAQPELVADQVWISGNELYQFDGALDGTL